MYSCRNKKGTHRAVLRLNQFAKKAGQNNSRPCFFLKCDIKKFFDSIDQDILIKLLKKKIINNYTLWLLEKIIKSFERGLPLGNITSQLFANIYLNELDQFVKHQLRVKYYIRYCDDFVITNCSQSIFNAHIQKINHFLEGKLKLLLHPNKIIIRKYHQGIDFLGYVIFPYHRVLRTKTKRRILRKLENKQGDFKDGIISKESFHQTIQSYFGVLSHCNGYKIKEQIKSLIQGIFMIK